MNWKMLGATLQATAVACAITNGAYARGLSPQEKAMIREAVTKDFKDPGAAAFKWLPLLDRAKWSPDPDHAGRSKFLSCGLVNGKNAFGGYIGYAPYAVGLTMEKNSIVAVELIGIAQGDQASIAFIPPLCEQNGQDTKSAR